MSAITRPIKTGRYQGTASSSKGLTIAAIRMSQVAATAALLKGEGVKSVALTHVVYFRYWGISAFFQLLCFGNVKRDASRVLVPIESIHVKRRSTSKAGWRRNVHGNVDLLARHERRLRGNHFHRPARRNREVGAIVDGLNSLEAFGKGSPVAILNGRGTIRLSRDRISINLETVATALVGVVPQPKDEVCWRVSRHHVDVILPQVVVGIGIVDPREVDLNAVVAGSRRRFP